MPAIVVLVLLTQVGFVVHAARTGRPRWWITVIILAPGAGCLAYFVAEVVPDLLGSRASRQAAARVADLIDPDRDYRAAADRFADADTVETRQALAREALRRNRPEEAVMLYEGALAGIHANDPHLLLALAEALAAAGRPDEAVQRFEQLHQAHPRFLSTDGRLLYARALEAADCPHEAMDAYEALLPDYPGEEARCRLALLHIRLGQIDRAHLLLRETLTRIERAPRHYRESQRPWQALAKQHLG